MTKIINLFAGPGAGKSTTAAGLFYHLKLANIKCELVTEYVKELVYDGIDNIALDPIQILAEQNKRVMRLINKVDYIITDSPILLGLVYNLNGSTVLGDLILETWNSYSSKDFNYFIKREKPYLKYGRFQGEDEAKVVDKSIKDMLDNINVGYKIVNGNSAVDDILKDLNLLWE